MIKANKITVVKEEDMSGYMKIILGFVLVSLAGVFFLPDNTVVGSTIATSAFLIAFLISMVIIVIGAEDIKKEGIKIGKNNYFGKIITKDDLCVGLRYVVISFVVDEPIITIVTHGKINTDDTNPGQFAVTMYLSDIPNESGKITLNKGDIIAINTVGRIFFSK